MKEKKEYKNDWSFVPIIIIPIAVILLFCFFGEKIVITIFPLVIIVFWFFCYKADGFRHLESIKHQARQSQDAEIG